MNQSLICLSLIEFWLNYATEKCQRYEDNTKKSAWISCLSPHKSETKALDTVRCKNGAQLSDIYLFLLVYLHSYWQYNLNLNLNWN